MTDFRLCDGRARRLRLTALYPHRFRLHSRLMRPTLGEFGVEPALLVFRPLYLTLGLLFSLVVVFERGPIGELVRPRGGG